MSSAPQTASSKNTSLNSQVPVSCSMGRTVMPGWSMANRKNPSPLCPTDSGSVRAMAKQYRGFVGQGGPDLLPGERHWPLAPSKRALVLTLARSEPALGSE